MVAPGGHSNKGKLMSLGKQCANHGIPETICSACKGAAEERERIVFKLKEFARILEANDDQSFMYYMHAIQLINAAS